jgi:hypothetical protein
MRLGRRVTMGLLTAVLCGSTLITSAAPAQAVTCGVKQVMRFNGPTAKYGVQGDLLFHINSVDCLNGGAYNDALTAGVELYKDTNHYLYFGWYHVVGCTAGDQSCIKWFVNWIDGNCLYCSDYRATYFGNQDCVRFGSLGTFWIRSNTPGQFDFMFKCAGSPAVQLRSTTDNAQHPTLTFNTARASLEVERLGDTSLKGQEMVDLSAKKSLAVGMDPWPNAPACSSDGIIGWDGVGTHVSSGGVFTTKSVTNDLIGC